MLKIYHALHPPSTIKLAPVIYDEASDAKNKSGPLYSSLLAILPRIVFSEYFFTKSFFIYDSFKTPPKDNVFTLMFFLFQYAAKYLVKLITAPFVAA